MSDFMDLFHDSMCALSVMRCGRFTLCTKPALASACLKSPARNSTPRSLCSNVPAGGLCAQGCGQRPPCQARRPIRPQRPAQQTSRIAIHDGGEVAPRSPYFQVRDIGHPDLVGPIHRHFVNPIVDAGEEAIDTWATAIQVGRAATDGVVTHQTFDPPPTHRFAITPQTGMDPRTAVCMPTFVVHLTDTLK